MGMDVVGAFGGTFAGSEGETVGKGGALPGLVLGSQEEGDGADAGAASPKGLKIPMRISDMIGPQQQEVKKGWDQGRNLEEEIPREIVGSFAYFLHCTLNRVGIDRLVVRFFSLHWPRRQEPDGHPTMAIWKKGAEPDDYATIVIWKRA